MWDSSDTDEEAAASYIRDSSEEEDMRENIEKSTAEGSYSQEEEGHVCDKADSEEECDSQEEEKMPLERKDVAVPTMVKQCNEFMGGVDKSDQFMSYHHVLCQTIRYWKTLFYHLIEIMATNTYIFCKWVRMERSDKRKTERCFRDELVLDIIRRYCSSAAIANVDQIHVQMLP